MADSDEILSSLLQVATIAEVCIERRLLLPALILIYSGIDTMGWLVSEDPGRPVRERFTGWVDRFMFPENPLPCSSLDLYAARCGILHTLTPDSELAAKGKAKPIYYAWGQVAKERYDQLAAIAPRGGFALLRVEDLSESFRRGVARTIEVGTTDGDLARIIVAKSGKFMTFVPNSVMFPNPNGTVGAA